MSNKLTEALSQRIVAKANDNPLETWQQFKSHVESTTRANKSYWYRGQVDATWGLKTTFHREADRTGMTLPSYLSLIEGELHYQLCSRLNERLRTEDPFEFASYLALLRNHGFPTPMLDWTLSPYIGAFFAFRECVMSKPACGRVRIFAFDGDAWVKTYQQSKDLRLQTPHVSVIRPYAKYNPRQLAQNTVYTVTNISDVTAHLLKHKKTEDFIYSVDLPTDIWKDVMRELDLMGINEMTMFPDMDGLCREMKKKYFPH